jgi:acid phosphatase type 7
VINSNCSKVGGCQAGSAQEQWLRADLSTHPAACTLAYWHHPRFSSGEHGSTTAM